MLNWNNLTQEERVEYMRLQMSPSYGGRSAYYPDDVSECGACGQPCSGAGWCANCLHRKIELDNKLRGRWVNQHATLISVLSENWAGLKLKRIEWKNEEVRGVPHSLVSFIFEGDNDEEWRVQVFGEDMSPSWGKTKSGLHD